jgi:O-antigen ligase
MAGEEPGRVAESGAAPSSSPIALWILIALAVLTPWPFGSTPSWAVRGITLIALSTAILVSLQQARRGALSLSRGPLVPLAVLVALGLIQLVPMPGGLHAIVAPGSAAVWHPEATGASSLLTADARPISIHPAATAEWLGTTGAILGLAALGAPALGRRRMVTAVTWTLLAAGTLVAIYGIVARALFGPLLYGHIAVPTVSPFGPFVNKNHFAGYVEMPALLALGLGRGLWRQHAKASDTGVPAPTPDALVAFGASAAMVMAVLLSLSRGGALGVLSGIATFAFLDYTTARHRSPLGKVVAPVALASVLVAILVLMPGEVHERLLGIARSRDNSTLYRVAIWKDALHAWMASPLVGQGLGAFADAIPRFKTTAGLFRVNHPESEPLEIAVEGGLVALCAAAAALGFLFVRAIAAIRGHRDRVQRGIVTGALAGMVALTVHGLVDFNLRIPSNALMFVSLAVLAAAPLGCVAHAGRRRWAFPAALALIALVSARAADPWPLLRDARASALKVDPAAPALRLALADRHLRQYLAARPADPEAWLLASWVAARAGRTDDATGLVHHAIALDPQSPALLAAAKAVTDGLPRR